MKETRDSIVAQLQGLGWTKAQAVGIAANLHQESSFNPAAVGDGGRAYGIAQWHPDRQAEFKKWAGKDIRGSSLSEQVAFVDYELRQGNERAAGKRLAQAQTASDAASVVSQHYERPADRAGEALRRSRTAAGWAGEAAAPAPAPQEGPKSAPGDANDWPRLPTLTRAQKSDSAASTAFGFQAVEGARQGSPEDLEPRSQAYTQQAIKDQEARDAGGIIPAFKAHLGDPRTMDTFAVADYINRPVNEDAGIPDPGAWYMEHRDEIEGGVVNTNEVAYLRENVRGPNSLARAQARLALDREADKVYQDSGVAASLVSGVVAGALDPTGFVAGLGLGKVLQVAKIGSRSLMMAGRARAATASFVAENVIGNVGMEAVADAVGEVRSVDDYVTAAAMGVGFSAPFVRSVHAEAASRYAQMRADELAEAAVRNQLETMDRIHQETGLTGRELVSEYQRREASAIAESSAEGTTPAAPKTAAIPDEVAAVHRQEYEQPRQEAPVQEPAPTRAPPLPPPPKVGVEQGLRQERLPASLSKAAPRYSYGSKQFTLQFESDIDRAAYIVAGKNKSKAHDQYVQFLESAGISEASARRRGELLRKQLKDEAKDAEPGLLRVPAESDPAPRPPVADKAPEKVPAKLRAGGKSFDLVFATDLDRAAYNVASMEPDNPARERELAVLKAAGFDEDVAVAHGALLREQAQAKAAALQDVPDKVALKVGVTDEGFLDLDPGKRGAAVMESEQGPVTVQWTRQEEPDAAEAKYYTVQEVLDGMVDTLGVPKHLAQYANYLSKALSNATLDAKFRFKKPEGGVGKFSGATDVVQARSMLPEGRSVEDHLADMAGVQHINPRLLETPLHEITHAATASRVQAYLDGVLPEGSQAYRGARGLEDLRLRVKQQVFRKYADDLRELGITPGSSKAAITQVIRSGRIANYELERLVYAISDLHEFSAMGLTDARTRGFLAGLPGQPVAGKTTSAWRTFLDSVGRLLGIKDGNALYEFSQHLDILIASRDVDIRKVDGSPALMDITRDPGDSEGTDRTAHLRRMIQHAQAWLEANPRDPARLRVLTNYVKEHGGLSDGLVLAQSDNPVMQMVAGLVVETTTGPFGRPYSSVALRTHRLHQELVGNLLVHYDNSFATWAQSNHVGVVDRVLTGDARRQFNLLVTNEILDRQNPNHVSTADAAVQEAAQAVEDAMDRSRRAQVRAGTLGSAGLPASSRGYMPRAMNAAAFQALSAEDANAVHRELSRQFQANMGWTPSFADMFAARYTDYSRHRAMGQGGEQHPGGGGGPTELIRQVLEDMNLPRSEVDRLLAGNSGPGIKSTRRRLDLDLRAEFLPGRQLLEVYSTDPLTLARKQLRQVAGEVALTEHNILGVRGVTDLRASAIEHMPGVRPATLQELDAYDRVMAEIMGNPVPGQEASNKVTNLMLLTRLQKLGGMAITQASELWNGVHHVGLRQSLALFPHLPRLLGEVGRGRRGQRIHNPILGTIEPPGAEFGTAPYKMVAPLDPPEGRLEDYLKQPDVVSRLLRTAGHAHARVSFFRGVIGAQHRHFAEQIVIKALQYIRDGRESRALDDMGITQEIRDAMRQDLDAIATWRRDGGLESLDITRLRDPRVAEAFIEAIHRGVGQIIQETYIGERSKWMHNDYAKALLQFRTYGLTGMEKQLSRTYHNYGYAGLAGALMVQIAAAIPLYAARVHAAALGMDEQKREEFLQRSLAPQALVRAALNYSSTAGLTGDALDTLTALAGWGGPEAQQLLTGREGQKSGGVGSIVPAFGTIDSALKAATGGLRRADGTYDTAAAARMIPFSNIPYIQPWMNLVTRED